MVPRCCEPCRGPVFSGSIACDITRTRLTQPEHPIFNRLLAKRRSTTIPRGRTCRSGDTQSDIGECGPKLAATDASQESAKCSMFATAVLLLRTGDPLDLDSSFALHIVDLTHVLPCTIPHSASPFLARRHLRLLVVLVSQGLFDFKQRLLWHCSRLLARTGAGFRREISGREE